VEVISIIDHSSVLSSYLKVYSIIKSATRSQTLSFRFLVLDDLEFNKLEKLYRNCFPDIRIQFKRWQRPATLPPLSERGFDSEYIYSRVYLPDIFYEVDRYVYLDNDVIVNMNIEDLFWTSLVRATHPLTTHYKIKPKHAQRDRSAASYLRKNRPGGGHGRQTSVSNHQTSNRRVTMGFVFDSNLKLDGYVKNGFNQSNPAFINAMGFIEPAKFFNGGVALVDAKLWRRRNMTGQAEDIIRQNVHNTVYSSRGLGDQGLFFLLMQDGLAELHPAFNMRRVPNKTTRYLKNQLGIVHFAGTTQGNARTICIDPVQYPVLSTGAVPLYLSVLKSVINSCPIRDDDYNKGWYNEWLGVEKTCLEAITKVQSHQEKGTLEIKFLPGHGNFYWPPP